MSKKLTILAIIQLILVSVSGIASKDMWYAISISIIGVLFNFLVSLGKPIGFWFGLVYAITNGALALHTGIYATFIFMIFLQSPMAIYSFFNWRKKEQNDNVVLKKMPTKTVVLMLFGMLFLGIAMSFALTAIQSTSVLVDAMFFVFSVCSCLLLAAGYKNAYIVTLLSGIGGTALWIYQVLNTGNGLSIAVFYIIVSINSIIAIHRQYLKVNYSNNHFPYIEKHEQ